jgi:predicted  nucleic acid-binding Zn-ribbon protein
MNERVNALSIIGCQNCGENQFTYLRSKAPDFIISSISSLEGGSATAGTGFAAPLGNQAMDDIIVVYEQNEAKLMAMFFLVLLRSGIRL